MEDVMNGLHAFSATTRFEKFNNDRIVFSCMVFTAPVTETQKRRLILKGIARIDNLEKDEKEPHESSAFYRDLAKATFEATRWEEPIIPIVICSHEELCLGHEYEYVKRICRRIAAHTNLSYGIIGVPRVLFQCLEKIVYMPSRVAPLSSLLN
jgi:hypothetical protein